MKKFKYSFKNKILFYTSYIYYKLFGLFEIKKGASSIYVAEFVWFLNQVFKLKLKLPDFAKTDYIETKFGKFFINPDLISTITVSPAFERIDINLLIKMIKSENKKKILFLDIGANFGIYTILIGNIFKKIDIISFEPNTEYLTLPTFPLLKKNVKINNLKNVKLIKVGIGTKKNKLGFKTKTLDSILSESFLKKFDSVYIKLDVDDFVLDALKGIEKSVTISKKTILLVEDFVDSRSIKYLSRKYKFITKGSSYNSFGKDDKTLFKFK